MTMTHIACMFAIAGHGAACAYWSSDLPLPWCYASEHCPAAFPAANSKGGAGRWRKLCPAPTTTTHTSTTTTTATTTTKVALSCRADQFYQVETDQVCHRHMFGASFI